MPAKKKTFEERKKELLNTKNSEIQGFGGKPLIDIEKIEYLSNPVNAMVEAEKVMNQKNMQKVSVTPRQRIIAFMAACGAELKDIAVATGYSANWVRNILDRGSTKEEIEKIQYRLFSSQSKKVFEDILPSAIETALKIMLDENQKGGVRLTAAQDFMDRATGKAVQRIEKEETQLVSVLIGRLQDSLPKAIQGQMKDDEREVTEIVEGDIIEPTAAPTSQPDETEKADTEISSWVEDNI
jgi:hypothetical protein